MNDARSFAAASVDFAVEISNSVIGNITNGNLSELLEEAEAALREIEARDFGPHEGDADQGLHDALLCTKCHESQFTRSDAKGSLMFYPDAQTCDSSISVLYEVELLMNQSIEQQLNVNKSQKLLQGVVDKFNEVETHANASIENSTLTLELNDENRVKLNSTMVLLRTSHNCLCVWFLFSRVTNVLSSHCCQFSVVCKIAVEAKLGAQRKFTNDNRETRGCKILHQRNHPQYHGDSISSFLISP